MPMTFDEYIQNPMGKKNAVYSNREIYRTMYKEKLDKILLRENGTIKYSLYVDKRKDTYYCHLKIPSEVIEKFYYDVVIMMYPDGSMSALKSLEKYNVKFYSNDPSFVFTFAHAMKVNDMFIDDLKSKMSKKALRTEAKEKNPQNEVGYVKSIFFAYLTMRRYGLFNKIKYETAPAYSKVFILPEIDDADKKIQARQNAVNERNKKKERKTPQEHSVKQTIKKSISDKVVKVTKTISPSKNSIRASTKSKFLKRK